jgi:hypothetical protein
VATPVNAVAERLTGGAVIHLKVKQSKLIRLPCNVSRVVLGNTPWDFTSTDVPNEGLLKGMFEGHAPPRAWCGKKGVGFDVYVDRP